MTIQKSTKSKAICYIPGKYKIALSGTMFVNPTGEKALAFFTFINDNDFPDNIPDSTRLIKNTSFPGMKSYCVIRGDNEIGISIDHDVHKIVVKMSDYEKLVYIIFSDIINIISVRKKQAKKDKAKGREGENVKLLNDVILVFLGLNRSRFINFVGTSTTKAPDQIEDTRFFKFNNKKFPFFFDSVKSDDVRANYSTDMFSIASVLFSYVGFDKLTLQALFTGNNIYVYENLHDNLYNSLRRNFEPIRQNNLAKINMYSANLIDFLRRTLTHDSLLRISCREALYHPLFRLPTNPLRSSLTARVPKTWR